jgi:hypothetical protein
MICPQCKAEYRSGFTVCADCEVPLVEPTDLVATRVVRRSPDEESGGAGAEQHTVAGEPGDPNEDPFCSFWKGTDLRVCTEVCSVLDEAGIPHKTIRRQDHLFNFSNQSPYEVGVPASLYEKAELAIKDAFGTDSEGAEHAVYESEEAKLLPNQTNHLTDAGILSPLMSVAKSQARGLSWDSENRAREEEFGEDTEEERGIHAGSRQPSELLEDIDPADATVKIWQGEDVDTREMLKMSLHENDIFARVEEAGPAVEVFVLPEDEDRAREIVREIVEGKPSE